MAHVPCRMITGDNPLTAASVGRECGLINQAAHVFSPSFMSGSFSLVKVYLRGLDVNIVGNPSTHLAKLQWSCMDDYAWKLDDYSLKPLTPPPHHTVETDELDSQDYSLIVTGEVFRWMINNSPLETLQRVSSSLCSP